MKQWVLSIAVTALFSAVVVLLLPNGKTNKIIKSILSFVVVLVIISPLLSLSKNEVSLDNAFGAGEITLQENYLSFYENSKLETFKKECLKLLEEKGIKIREDELNIITDCIVDGVVRIEKVQVYLKNAVIKTDELNIDIKDECLNVIRSYLDITSDKVVIYE